MLSRVFGLDYHKRISYSDPMMKTKKNSNGRFGIWSDRFAAFLTTAATIEGGLTRFGAMVATLPTDWPWRVRLIDRASDTEIAVSIVNEGGRR
jgi:hypothetical protein